MVDRIISFFSNLENFNNDQLLDYLTDPVGTGVLVAIIVIALFFKQKFLFISCATVLMGILLYDKIFRQTDGSLGSSALPFIAGAVFVIAFVIYQTLMKDE
ncbi:MAG: hypothetical protein C0609_02800 [Deltaproteobacteria bacterium]|nr:MAG: hypothetical protein C0609_02800 [Deltaproteobacteria bacterium]